MDLGRIEAGPAVKGRYLVPDKTFCRVLVEPKFSFVLEREPRSIDEVAFALEVPMLVLIKYVTRFAWPRFSRIHTPQKDQT